MYKPKKSYFFPNSRMLWGLSPHSLRGAPGHCSTLPPRFAGSGNQGSENRFREPGFGARFREPRVPGTRVRGKVPGTQGSANQTFKQGSGNNGFWLPFGFRDVKVPGSPGSRRQEGSGHTWLSTRFREPYHGFEQPEPGLCQSSGITGTPILRHPANPEFGEPGFWQGSSNTGFRQGSENHHRCGPTVWIYFLDYATGSGQGQGQSSGKVPRFRKQPRGRIYAVGCTKVHATDRVPENQFARKPRFQDQKGPVNEQSLTGGGTA